MVNVGWNYRNVNKEEMFFDTYDQCNECICRKSCLANSGLGDDRISCDIDYHHKIVITHTLEIREYAE